VREPEPEAPLVTFSQVAELVVVEEQPAGAVSVKLPVLLVDGTVADVGDST
jgi:hypothetical protein